MEGGDGKAGKFYEENFSLPDSPRLEMMVVIMVAVMAKGNIAEHRKGHER